ncbi:MAG: phage tail tube protein [Hydrogenophaga sp.]|nr:phage tail tube protein [Hydrogenophaga sp.]
MAQAKKWSNVQIAMQSALGVSKAVTAITLASTAVVTSTAHGLANGNYVLLTVQGMRQVNDRSCRIANVTANTFDLEGIDSTAFDAFTSGTAQAITFGSTISTATSISSSGGGFDFIDTTTIHDNARTQMPGLPAATTFTFDNIWDVSDAGLLAMKTASDAQAKRAFKFTFGAGGQIMTFNGYVGANLLPGGQAQGLVTTPTTITMNSVPSYFSS